MRYLRTVGGSSVRAGLIGLAAMVAFYVAVVAGSGGWRHLGQQVGTDWYLLLIVVLGFAAQVTLFAELHRRRRLYRAAGAATGAGAGASAVGMVACCAHHIADLLPFLGLTGIATFLVDYRVAFILLGVGVNALGVTVAVRRLRHLPPVVREEVACPVA